jgi:hypothetical protein
MTQIPSATNAQASGRVNRQPPGIDFSAKITPASTAIQTRLIAPSANRISISPQQQPTQNAPCSIPIRSAPEAPSRHLCSRNSSGERQCLRHFVFSGVS